MSEEEMKNQIEYIIEVVTQGDDYTLRYYDIQCIMRLLDLYKQEKEKNKRIEKYITDKVKIEGEIQSYISEKFVEDNYICKDKIKEKIEETNSEKLNYSEDEYYLENEVKGYAIDKLKELLEG